ncbi:hypothetical protein OESDEN_00616 [Oesophagostomum dentatum]|uniref:Peptidase C1A papain C-terminal domain-containing protein n=1 Tax=Oesophagostomum dentatum TaxID=61180 RepID=A0A0B1TP88_OESDE|nr:hypothetical protein OESDEN_00616 [Oesophagostomum dentatum]
MSDEEFMSRIMDDTYLGEHDEMVTVDEISLAATAIPASFDARKKWANCRSIKTVRDQSACGSCWAVSAASAMSDRVCVRSNGKNQKFVSDTDILACCKNCGSGYVY